MPLNETVHFIERSFTILYAATLLFNVYVIGMYVLDGGNGVSKNSLIKYVLLAAFFLLHDTGQTPIHAIINSLIIAALILNTFITYRKSLAQIPSDVKSKRRMAFVDSQQMRWPRGKTREQFLGQFEEIAHKDRPRIDTDTYVIKEPDQE